MSTTQEDAPARGFRSMLGRTLGIQLKVSGFSAAVASGAS